MAVLDIELSSDLIRGIKGIAQRHYGDTDDASIARVAEVALEIRLLWEDRVKGGLNEFEEPVPDWESADGQSINRLPAGIQEWLFKRR